MTTHSFGAESEKLLHLLTHALYTKKEIAIREIISNASDATDKRRYLSLTHPQMMTSNDDLKISVTINKENGCLIFRDNGIGMSEEEMISHLGTIAKSGTEEILKMKGNADSDDNLIGRFGIGFYSIFMLAKSAEVRSKKLNEDGSYGKTYCWKSNGTTGFETFESEDLQNCSTEIKAYLNDDSKDDFLDRFRIENFIKTHSGQIIFPIELTYFDEDKKENETIQLNNKKPIWTKNKSEITKEEYKEHFTSLSYLPDEPFMVLHNKNEGTIEFNNILYIPNQKPFDLFNPQGDIDKIKLYNKNVLITTLSLNKYLRFIYGVITSNDLPLNVNREMLQDDSYIQKIKNILTKKILSELKYKLSNEREEYEKFWQNFGSVLKEGLCEPIVDKEALMNIVLFKTNKSDDKFVTYEEYASNMKEDQKEIYYLVGENYNDIKNSSELEKFNQDGIEVIFLTDLVDSFCIQTTKFYKEKELKSITEISNFQEDENKAENEDLIKLFKEKLKDKFSDVKITDKLISTPATIINKTGGMDSRIEEILIENKQLLKASLKILAINPKHKMIEKIYSLLKSEDLKQIQDGENLLKILSDILLLSKGAKLHNPEEFGKNLVNILSNYTEKY